MSTRPDDPVTDEESLAAERFRAALEQDAVPEEGAAPAGVGQDDTRRLARVADLVAATAAPPLPDAVRARVERRVLARRHPLRAWWRLAWVGAALAAASVALTLWLRPAAIPAPRLPYARVFERPFHRDDPPLARLDRMLAWRRGALEPKEGP